MAQPNQPFGQRILFWLVPRLGAWLFKALFATCRIDIRSPEEYEQIIGKGKPAIGVTWHRGAIFFLYFLGHLKPAIMVSRSKDGEYLARYIELMGGIPVRGSSFHGGRQALDDMAGLIKSGQTSYGGTVADGPRGPRYQAKKGMLVLAQRTGLPLFPIMWSANRTWVLKNTWDRTMIPKPFSKIILKTGKMFQVPPELKGRELEALRQELEDEMMRLTRELDEAAGFERED